MDQRNALKARRDVELAKMKGMVLLCVAGYTVRGAPTHTSVLPEAAKAVQPCCKAV